MVDEWRWVMRGIWKVVATTLVVAFLAGLAHEVQAQKKKGAGAAVLLSPDEIKWGDVPGFPGVKLAAVQGDPAKGPHHAMIKFTPGFAAPMHHHSADHFVTVVTGTVVLTVDGQEKKLPPGSFFTFSGKKPHMTKCEAGAECLLSIDTRGKWDVVPEAAKK
jgi:quercetin dioxygenase-like cupin family protein